MAKQVIDTTTVQPNGKQGEPIRTAFVKTNANFDELYDGLQSVSADYFGSTAPAVTWPGMKWGRSTDDAILRRNATNDEWVRVGDLFDRPVSDSNPKLSTQLQIGGNVISSIILNDGKAELFAPQPFIDFKHDASADYEARIIFSTTKSFQLNNGFGDVSANGTVISNRDINTIHTYCMLKLSGSVDPLPGANVNGANLIYAASGGQSQVSAIGGTWKLMGRVYTAGAADNNPNRVGLFLRVA